MEPTTGSKGKVPTAVTNESDVLDIIKADITHEDRLVLLTGKLSVRDTVVSIAALRDIITSNDENFINSIQKSFVRKVDALFKMEDEKEMTTTLALYVSVYNGEKNSGPFFKYLDNIGDTVVQNKFMAFVSALSLGKGNFDTKELASIFKADKLAIKVLEKVLG